MDNEKVFAMKLSKIYPLLVTKAKRKNRTQQEVNTVICWLTGYTEEELEKKILEDVSYGQFFEDAPHMNPNCEKITGSICGVKIQEIEDPLMKKIRCLDKLVDELSKGKKLDKICKKESI